MTEIRTARPALLVICAALGLGTLIAAYRSTVDGIVLLGFSEDVSVYPPIAVLVLALLAWHLSPRWSWPVLLVLGALCTVPSQLFGLSRDLVESWLPNPYLAIVACAPPLLLVGLLGAATTVWQAGRHGIGAALLGAPLVVPPLMAMLVFTRANSDVMPITGLMLVAATVLTAIAAAVTSQPVASRPGWRVTIGGVVAGAIPVVFQLWQAPRPPEGEYPVDGAQSSFDVYYAETADRLMVLGPVVLGVALLAGLLAGARVLVTGAAAGLLLSAVSSTLVSAAVYVNVMSTETAWVLVLVAVTVGVAIATTRFRAVIGIGGAGAAAVILLVVWLDSGPGGEVVDAVTLGWVLMATAAVAAPVLATLGSALAADAAAPAAFAGVAAAVVLGVRAFVSSVTTMDFESIRNPTYLPEVVLLVLAGGLTLLAYRLWVREQVLVRVTGP